jgi:hypothetical protein
MHRSADLIDMKVFEADFFLDQMRGAGSDFFAARCYFSAFVSASRSITFAMQAVLHDTAGFRVWYASEQARLSGIPLAKFFLLARNESQKLGLTPLNQGSSRWRPEGPPEVLYYFSGGFEGDASLIPSDDVVSACTQHLTLLVDHVYRAYNEFKVLSPHSFFSVDRLRETTLSIDEIEEALGFPRGWTKVDGLDDATRLEMLRRATPDTAIDRMFVKYLGKARDAET